VRSTPLRTLRAFPTLLRIGVAETVAYRAEFLVWILTMTMPLVMLALWTSVAGTKEFANYSSAKFVAYYLAMLIVRNLTGTWVGWQLSEEIRLGTMSMRLLRPIHPFFAFAASHLAAIPFRSAVAVPIAIALLASSGAGAMVHDPVQLVLVLPSLVLAWLITFALLYAIGSLAFFLTQTMAIANIYFGIFTVMSGYLVPLDLMPEWVQTLARWTPFPAMLSSPVQMLTTPMAGGDIARLLATQAAWAAAALTIALGVWRVGVKRFEGVGA
jgi:ABC-2 type transport system permease protein